MESYKLVLPEHLNHWGYLFGGNLLGWIDEAAWIAATRDFPGGRLVTIGMDRVEFRQPIHRGAIVRLLATRIKSGRTSVTYRADAYCDNFDGSGEVHAFTTDITFVNVDPQGKASRLPDPAEST